MVEVNKEEGSQGETRNEVRWILLISTVLAALVLFAFLFFSAGNSPDENAGTSPSATAVQLIDTAYA